MEPVTAQDIAFLTFFLSLSFLTICGGVALIIHAVKAYRKSC